MATAVRVVVFVIIFSFLVCGCICCNVVYTQLFANAKNVRWKVTKTRHIKRANGGYREKPCRKFLRLCKRISKRNKESERK